MQYTMYNVQYTIYNIQYTTTTNNNNNQLPLSPSSLLHRQGWRRERLRIPTPSRVRALSSIPFGAPPPSARAPRGRAGAVASVSGAQAALHPRGGGCAHPQVPWTGARAARRRALLARIPILPSGWGSRRGGGRRQRGRSSPRAQHGVRQAHPSGGQESVAGRAGSPG